MHPPLTARRSFPRATAVVVALALALVIASCGSDNTDATPPPTSMAPPAEVDIPYGPVAGCSGTDTACGGSQQLDIYRSDETGPNPVLIWVHGGGFIGGDKGGSLSQYLEPLLDEGWDIVAVNYRLTSDGQNAFPTGLQDVKRAVRWVKANASAQDWDPNAVGAIGHSAGGNLVGMLAVTSGDESLEPPAEELPAELQAVDSSIIVGVAIAPVSDLVTFGQVEFFADAVQWYTDCTTDCAEQLAAGSVQTHVTSDAAPLMAIHGADDAWAAPSQGQLVQEAYDAAGIGDRFRLIIVSDGPSRFRNHDIDLERWVSDISEFVDDQLPPSP